MIRIVPRHKKQQLESVRHNPQQSVTNTTKYKDNKPLAQTKPTNLEQRKLESLQKAQEHESSERFDFHKITD